MTDRQQITKGMFEAAVNECDEAGHLILAWKDKNGNLSVYYPFLVDDKKVDFANKVAANTADWMAHRAQDSAA